MIKNLTFLFLFAVLAASSGCKKDENNEISVVGKWTVTAVEETSYFNGEVEDRSTDLDGEIVFEFRADGTGQDNTEGDVNEFTYITTSETLTIKHTNQEPMVFQIKKLTNSELRLYLEQSEIQDGNTYKEVVDFTLSR